MKKGANSSVDRKVVGSTAENESFNRHYNKELKVSEGNTIRHVNDDLR